MFDNRCYERENDMIANFVGDNNEITNEMNMEINTMGMMPNDNTMQTSCCQSQAPIVEPMKERCIHREIYHEVPHVCPMKTRIINHHIYKHTYRPQYSCQEENIVSNMQCGSCNQFR